jgi:hypothetical protein
MEQRRDLSTLSEWLAGHCRSRIPAGRQLHLILDCYSVHRADAITADGDTLGMELLPILLVLLMNCRPWIERSWEPWKRYFGAYSKKCFASRRCGTIDKDLGEPFTRIDRRGLGDLLEDDVKPDGDRQMQTGKSTSDTIKWIALLKLIYPTLIHSPLSFLGGLRPGCA